MRGKAFFITCLFIIFFIQASGQSTELAKITIDAGNYERDGTLINARFEGIDLDIANYQLVLYNVDKPAKKRIESQLDMHSGPILWWKLDEKLSAGKTATFSLRKEKKTIDDTPVKVQVLNDHGNLVAKIGMKHVLQYNFMEAPLPEGVPGIYNRAGYIHPLWSPKGEVLTRIQPPDHYHHVGIWNPWTHTEYKGKMIDFWNLMEGQGTVRPNTIVSTISGDLFGGFRVIHDHIDLNGKTPNGFEVALKEEWDVRVWNVNENSWLIDFISTMNCATDSALTIMEYRYQGFGFRATQKWDDQTASILTSEGKNKADGNSTRARWCDVNGVSAFGTSGILFITHPSNYNYPEPIRIWPVGANQGKENVFFNFNPAMDRDWMLKPGNDYQLKYRMYVYDGKIDQAQAESLWADFTHPPKVTIEIIE